MQKYTIFFKFQFCDDFFKYFTLCLVAWCSLVLIIIGCFPNLLILNDVLIGNFALYLQNINKNFKRIIMKINFFYLLIAFVFVGVLLNSCSKDDNAVPTITFSQAEGTANSKGEYTLTGHIHSDVRLDKVIITKEGATVPFLTDDSTAKNKTNYDYSYLITGITTNTTLIIDVYNQENDKSTFRYLIRK